MKEKLTVLTNIFIITLCLGIIASFFKSEPIVQNVYATGAVCPAGNVKFEIDGGYEYNDGSANISGNSSNVIWSINPGFQFIAICVKIGGPQGGTLIYPGFEDGQWGTDSYGISHVVAYTSPSQEEDPTSTPTPTPTTEPTSTPTPTPTQGTTPTPTPTDDPCEQECEPTPTPTEEVTPTPTTEQREPTPTPTVVPNETPHPQPQNDPNAGVGGVQGTTSSVAAQGQVLGASTLAATGSVIPGIMDAMSTLGVGLLTIYATSKKKNQK